jgi:urease accessory protein
MPRLQGKLDLTCALGPAGRTILRQQFFSGPFHVSKPYHDGDLLVVQIVNPTAGILKGDQLRSCVRLEPGARLHYSTPSASRIFSMPDGSASVEQRFEIAAGAWLDYWPAPLIPQAGGRLRQRTVLEAEAGAEIFFAEVLAPGRVARGECFQFGQLDWSFELRVGGRRLARERFVLDPSDPRTIQPLRTLYPNSYYASGWLLSARLSAEHADAAQNDPTDGALLGVSQVCPGLWSFRILACDSVALGKALVQLRRNLARSVPELLCRVRKL